MAGADSVSQMTLVFLASYFFEIVEDCRVIVGNVPTERGNFLAAHKFSL